MTPHQYSISDQHSSYPLDHAPYPPLQQSVNPSQSQTFMPYEGHSQSQTISYDPQSRGGYETHLSPSNPSSPVVSHRAASSGSSNAFTLPSHLQTISPTAIYQHQSDPSLAEQQARTRSHSNPHSYTHSRSQSQSLSHARDLQMSVPSPTPSAVPFYHNQPTSYLSQAAPHHQGYELPDPRASRPHLSIAVSGGLVGHAEGWSAGPESATTELPPPIPNPNPTPSPRSRTTSLGGGVGGGTGKKKKASPRSAVVPLPARKRSPASCAPCRKKKLKCDRSLPCSSCIAKGTECIWEGDATPLYIKDEHELQGTKELQAQVDRLQAIVDELASSPKSNRTSLRFDSMTASEEASIDSSPTFELLAHDYPQSLLEVTLENVLPHQQVGELAASPMGRNADSLVDEARIYCRSAQRKQSTLPLSKSLITPSNSSAEVSPSSSFFPPTRTNDAFASRLLKPQSTVIAPEIPSQSDLKKASAHFFDAISVLVPLIDRSRWNQISESIQQGSADASGTLDPASVALVVAVATFGLSRMTDEEASLLSTPDDRPATIARWLEVSASALLLSKFPEIPTYNGIRAALILASTLFTTQPSDEDRNYTSAMMHLSSAVRAAFALELNREPNRNGKNTHRFSECQERRRLFWAVFSVCSAVTTDTSRMWPDFDLRYVDTHFPLDCFDDELAMDELAIRASVRARVNCESFEETPMTFNLSLARLAFVAKKISEEAYIVGGCRYSRIPILTAELRNLEKSLPPCFRIQYDSNQRPLFDARASLSTSLKAAFVQASISAEIIRLNRPFLTLAAADDKYHNSRERAVIHAKRVLAIATEPLCSPLVAELSNKVVSSAIVLAVELLQSPEEADASVLRSLIQGAVELLHRNPRCSVIAAVGARLIHYMMDKLQSVHSGVSGRRHRAKRPRTNQQSPQEQPAQLRQSWLHSIPNSTYPSRAGSPDSDSEVVNLRRKTTRPALKHSARSESHLSSRARFAPRPPPLARTHRSHSAEEFPTSDGLTMPLSPATTATSAPSVAAVSPVISLDNSQQLPRNRTFSDPASSFHLSGIAESTQQPEAHTMFRYYQAPSLRSHRASYGTTLESGLGLIDFAQHGRPLGTSPFFDENEPTDLLHLQHEEQMETEDVRNFDHSSTIEDYAIVPEHRHFI